MTPFSLSLFLCPYLILAKDLRILFEKAEIQQKRVLLKMIVSNLELDGDLLRWKYKKPFETMALCTENSNWLTLADALRTACLDFDKSNLNEIKAILATTA